MTFTIATWNVNSVNARLEHLIDFLEQDNPDIVLLQEIKCINERFPYEALSHLPYNVYVHGQKSYHGVAILSKFRASDTITTFVANPLPEEARFIEIHCNIGEELYRVISLYAPNGAEAGSPKYLTKLAFYDSLIQHLQSINTDNEKIIIGGDFNIAPFDIDVYDPKDLEGVTSFTEPEKIRLRKLLNNGFLDLYRINSPDIQEFSWWDYRGGSLAKNTGMRIDFLLGNNNVAKNLKKCYIDINPRLKPKPSDHTIVIAEIAKNP